MLTGYDDLPTIENAKHDRIKVQQKSWILSYPSESALQEFVLRLRTVVIGSDSDTIEYSQLEGDLDESTGWIFVSAPNSQRRGLTRLNVRRSRTTSHRHRFGMPLFKGSIDIRESPQTAQASAVITSTLYLNPTRFARWQDAEEGSAFVFWTPRRRFRERGRNQSLDRSDNYMSREQYQRFDGADAWFGLLESYWSGVVGEIEREFSRASMAAEASFRRQHGERNSTKVKEVEVYWEMASDDALNELSRIRPILRGIGRDSRESSYPTIIGDIERDCPSFTIQLCNGVKLRVYAKTETRIRFEVAYKLGGSGRYQLRGGTAGDEPAILNRICREAAIDASNRLSEIFPLLSEVIPRAVTLMDFFDALHSSSSSLTEATAILRLLVANGSVSIGRRGTIRRRAIDKLIRREVLRSSPVHSGSAFLSEDYRSLLNHAFPSSSLL